MLNALEEAVCSPDALAVAVSGGVDSMTLAAVAHRARNGDVTMIHAISPAVPEAATARVRRHAERHGWATVWLDAGEMADPRYRENPLNRCYFCKTNLYGRMREHTAATIASGTNTDDLGDFRPGLAAADEHSVIHPYVTAGIDKAGVYALARDLGLTDLAALPAQPCLASRIQTGVVVTAPTLRFIEKVEALAATTVPSLHDVRCRVRSDGIALEVAPFPDAPTAAALESTVAQTCTADGHVFLGLAPYKRGSAFVGLK
ncbi:MAG: adenine nucleotide alpha hydrolase [Pseudomonadota bacterium]